MIIKNSEFIISAVNPKQYPEDNFSQIVLVGKSNVGKSSFINTMLNRKKLARTSSEPGKTRLINFYKILGEIQSTSSNNDSNDVHYGNTPLVKNDTIPIPTNFYFVDLPGYGFSKMSKAQQVEVGNFIEEYLQKCKSISLVIFLIDIRHNPTEDDKLMYQFIVNNNLPCIIVANKADKIAVTKVSSQVSLLQQVLNPLHDLKFLPYSSERKIYSDEVWKEIEAIIK